MNDVFEECGKVHWGLSHVVEAMRMKGLLQNAERRFVNPRRAFGLGRDGAGAATAGRVVSIAAADRLVRAAPDWWGCPVREWAVAEPPVLVLVPRPAEWRPLLERPR